MSKDTGIPNPSHPAPPDSTEPDASIISVATSHSFINIEETFRKRGYELGKVLGEGAYAKVYLASYTDPKPPNKKLMLACKVIDVTKAPKEFVRKFFPREMTIICKINHHNLVRVHSILKLAGKHFIFMTLCENGDVLKFMKLYGAVREGRARTWFSQILDGISYLHNKNIVHRDLKCENILLTNDYNVRIADFGFARGYAEGDEKSKTFCGSVMYAPPEVIHGKPYNPKFADLWSLGIVLFIMLNKSMPFDDSSLRKLYEAQMGRQWKVRSKLKDVLSSEVKTFLYTLLEPVPEKRRTIPQLQHDAWFLKTNLSEGKRISQNEVQKSGSGGNMDAGARSSHDPSNEHSHKPADETILAHILPTSKHDTISHTNHTKPQE